MEDSQIAAALSAQLAARIGAQRYELWFGPQTQLCVGPACLKILAASTFVRDWLRRNFADDIRCCWEGIVGRPLPIEFEVDPSLPSANVTDREPGTRHSDPCKTRIGTLKPLHAANRDSTPATTCEPKPRPWVEMTLAGFEVGPCNEYAFRSAELTARGRQQASPVLLCGPTGVGKTHLLRAIVRDYRRHNPRGAAIYLSAEQFTTSFLEALRGSGLPSFRQKCRGASLLAIDDLPFFAGKARTLEEFLYTVDSLLAEGRQLVLASDRSIVELRGLGPELLSRLSGGLICELEPPEFATRLGILRRLRDELRIAAPDEVLSRVAAEITGGARELRGALHRLQTVSAAINEPISGEMADSALRDLARQSVRPVKLPDVEHAVCDVFGVEPAQLRSDGKGRALCEPRMLAMWLARRYTRAAWSEIAQYFGRRSHSTVIAAHRRVERLISAQAEIGLCNRSCGVDEAIRRLETALRRA
jgi:chromosomal replication initiator protein